MQCTNISSWRWPQFKSLSTAPYIGKSCLFFSFSKACKNMSSRNSKKMHLASVPRSGAFALRQPSEQWFLLDLHLLIGNSNLFGEKAPPHPIWSKRSQVKFYRRKNVHPNIVSDKEECCSITLVSSITFWSSSRAYSNLWYWIFCLDFSRESVGQEDFDFFSTEEIGDQTSRSV